MAATAAASHPLTEVPVGDIKTFGEYGPMYEVLGPAPQGKKGEMVAIRVVLSGETLDYPLADMLTDPLVP